MKGTNKFIPQLARRTNVLRPEGAYAVLNKATKLEQQGKQIIHLEIGQPDFPTPKNIADAGIKAIRNGFTKYNPPLGINPLREKIAYEVGKSRNIDVKPSQIAVTPSGKTAIFIALSAILEKGDEVIYPNPGFPTYQTLIDYFGCIRKPIPLLEKNGFSFDMSVFKKSISSKTKAIILNSPSNPTGGIIPQKDLLQIADLVKNTNCWVITDEMYAKIIYDGLEYPSYYGINNVQNRTILVDGFSKTYSMTGWRIGYLAAPEKIMNKIDCLLTHTVGCAATFTQYAVLEALNGLQTSVVNMNKEFVKRRNFIVDELNHIKGVSCATPRGAFYVFPNIKKIGKSSKWLADFLLEEGKVALLPGTAFGEYGEGYLRISYANSLENLKEGLRRINISVKKLL